jgi:outer membrane protein insertion porin family
VSRPAAPLIALHSAVVGLLLSARSVLAQPAPAPAVPAAPPAAEAPDTWGAGSRPAPARATTTPDDDLMIEVEEQESLAPRASQDASDVSRVQRAPSDMLVRYSLEAIEIRGNSRTRSRVVLRYIPFKPGDIIDVDDPEVELTRYRLLGTGFFRDVQFSLRKGSERGRVILVVEVEERNTVVVNDLWMGLSRDADTEGVSRPLTAYAGVDVAETNVAGTGITLGGAFGIAAEQLALRVRFLDPAFLGSRWMTSGSLLFNDAKDFFGNSGVRKIDLSQLQAVDGRAVVSYTRFGGNVGVGRDLSVPTQLWFHYRLETIDADVPSGASHLRSGVREPIQFSIIPGRSVLSTARLTLLHDTRDQPFLPTRGWSVAITGESGLPFGSDYVYQRLDIDTSRWWQLPWADHVLRLQLFGGAIGGDAPFFEQYYVNDFSDFRPARVLGLNFDRRPPPDFFQTAIVEVRRGHYAAKVGLEYRIPLYRGQRAVYGIDFFASSGLYAVAGRRDLTHPPRRFSGAARIPIDLTANLGFRMDTSAGGFVFAFANAIGLLPVTGQDDQ